MFCLMPNVCVYIWLYDCSQHITAPLPAVSITSPFYKLSLTQFISSVRLFQHWLLCSFGDLLLSLCSVIMATLARTYTLSSAKDPMVSWKITEVESNPSLLLIVIYSELKYNCHLGCGDFHFKINRSGLTKFLDYCLGNFHPNWPFRS